jgi:hypothetical protein
VYGHELAKCPLQIPQTLATLVVIVFVGVCVSPILRTRHKNAAPTLSKFWGIVGPQLPPSHKHTALEVFPLRQKKVRNKGRMKRRKEKGGRKKEKERRERKGRKGATMQRAPKQGGQIQTYVMLSLRLCIEIAAAAAVVAVVAAAAAAAAAVLPASSHL